jgi:hypothetical protein
VTRNLKFIVVLIFGINSSALAAEPGYSSPSSSKSSGSSSQGSNSNSSSQGKSSGSSSQGSNSSSSSQSSQSSSSSQSGSSGSSSQGKSSGSSSQGSNSSSSSQSGHSGSSSQSSSSGSSSQSSGSSSSSQGGDSGSTASGSHDSEREKSSTLSANGGSEIPQGISAGNNLQQPPTSRAIAIVTGIKNATMSAVKVGVAAVNVVVNRTAIILEEHIKAMQAGSAAYNSINITGKSKLEARMAQERAYYNAVREAYEFSIIGYQNQKLTEVGPVQLMTNGLSNTQLSLVDQETMLEWAKNVDNLYLSGKANIAMPGTLKPVEMAELLGPVYSNLNEIQKFGLSESIVVVGEFTMTQVATELAGTGVVAFTSSVPAYNGHQMVVVSNTDPQFGIAATHESQHAGDTAIIEAVNELLGDPTLSPGAKAHLAELQLRAKAVQSKTMSTLAEVPSAAPKTANQEYLDSLFEFRAYAIQGDHGALWKENMASAHPDMTAEEINDLFDNYASSPALEQYDNDLTELLDAVQAQRGKQ